MFELDETSCTLDYTACAQPINSNPNIFIPKHMNIAINSPGRPPPSQLSPAQSTPPRRYVAPFAATPQRRGGRWRCARRARGAGRAAPRRSSRTRSANS
eukprot:scaffold2377_cov74-Phaeocystis_antarctica.AAC.5